MFVAVGFVVFFHRVNYSYSYVDFSGHLSGYYFRTLQRQPPISNSSDIRDCESGCECT